MSELRAQFEEYASERDLPDDFTIRKSGGGTGNPLAGTYRNYDIQRHWDTYQAATRAAYEKFARVVEAANGILKDCVWNENDKNWDSRRLPSSEQCTALREALSHLEGGSHEN